MKRLGIKYIPAMPLVVRNQRPNATVPKDAKCICGAPATRWDGGYQAVHYVGITSSVMPAHSYRCDEHDPHHKWFDIDESDREGYDPLESDAVRSAESAYAEMCIAQESEPSED